MRKFFTLISFLYLCGLTYSIFDNSLDYIPEELFPVLFGNAAESKFGNPCNDIELNKAQADFNVYLNLSADLTWRNSNTLWIRVRQMFKNGSIPSFQYVCSGRDKFESHLRTRGIYDSCLSRYFLMNKQGADWTTVMTYIRLYQHLDFICNQGFEQIAQTSVWSCLQKNLNTGCDQTCDTNWNNWNGNYATLCPTVQSYSSCKKTCWDQNCAGTNLGYYACEDVRIGFAQDCRGLRCYVN